MDLAALTIGKIRDLLTRKQVSAQELVGAHLQHIEERDKEVRAFLSLCPERARPDASMRAWPRASRFHPWVGFP